MGNGKKACASWGRGLSRDCSHSSVEEDMMATDLPEEIGHRIWAIPEGYIPGASTGPEPEMTSHETACILNTGRREAHVRITVFFSDRDPIGPYEVTVPGRRTLHLRFNELEDPASIPRDTDYASLFTSDFPVVIQHSRLDSRQAENALLTTMAFPSQ
jgi:hypothetical protein